MANTLRLQSVVAKTSIQPFSKPRAHQQPSKIQSLEEVMGHLSNEERLTVELERFGHFTVGEEGRWTQAEVDVEWARLNTLKEQNTSTERSLAFVLNWDFKPAPEPQYIIVDDDPQPSKPVIAQDTPSNYWDEWRAREGIVVRHLTQAQYGDELRQKKAEEERQKEVAKRLLKKRKSDEDWGKYFYFYFKN